LRRTVLLTLLGLAICSAKSLPLDGLQRIAPIVDSVRARSFPQLQDAEITLRAIRSDYIFLEGRFSFTSYFLAPKLHYIILFNPDALARHVPPDALQAIVAHELSHIDYLHRHRRLGLLRLIRLLSAAYTARFERGADLQAIALGYGPGLESYRTWLYRNIPPKHLPEKMRDYFSPEEIEAILAASRRNPQVMDVFSARPPRNLAEILSH
jgi:integrase